MIHHAVHVGEYTIQARAWPSDDVWVIDVYELPWEVEETYHHPIGTYCAEEAKMVVDMVAKKYKERGEERT